MHCGTVCTFRSPSEGADGRICFVYTELELIYLALAAIGKDNRDLFLYLLFNHWPSPVEQ